MSRFIYVLNDLEKNNFFQKNRVSPFRDGLANDNNFFDNSAISQEIILIFELDRDIDETIMCTKFQLNPI